MLVTCRDTDFHLYTAPSTLQAWPLASLATPLL
jgi:hypothetical protein